MNGHGQIRPFPDTYLLDYSKEHVAYEIDMLFEGVALTSIVSGLVVAEDRRRMTNLIVEGFGLHLRNVLDFLYSDRPQPTDIVATDYCAVGAWEAARGPLTTTLRDSRVSANKELAHLTSARQFGTPPSKSWDYQGLLAEVRPILKVFAGTARGTAVSPDVIRQIQAL